MANLREIKKIYKLYKRKKVEIAILHCISSYPNKEESSYLSNIDYLNKYFNCQIGLSDHTNDIKIAIYSYLLGSNIIEKHIKISANHKCVDFPVSINGKQLNKLNKELIKIKQIKGQVSFGVRKEEKTAKQFKRNKIL